MTDDRTYLFTDIAGEHFMILGPGGTSWLPLNHQTEDHLHECFCVTGWVNAVSFAAFMKNEHDGHCKPMEILLREDEETLLIPWQPTPAP